MLLTVSMTLAATARRPVAEYTINLDLPPANRYDNIVGDPSNGFNKTVW